MSGNSGHSHWVLDRLTTQYHGVVHSSSGQLEPFAYMCGHSFTFTSQELPASHPRNIRSQMVLKRIGVAAKRQRCHCVALPPAPPRSARQATVASCGMIGISKSHPACFLQGGHAVGTRSSPVMPKSHFGISGWEPVYNEVPRHPRHRIMLPK